MMKKIVYIALLMVSINCNTFAQGIPDYKAVLLEKYDTFDAVQAVAVDKDHFYAINDFRMTKHRKMGGEPVMQWDGEERGKVLFHLDSGMVMDGKLYAAHSNYANSPMTSSVEIWDVATMEHVSTGSFGINRGSFTWLDHYDGHWWGTFANYDRIQDGQTEPYGKTENTKVVKLSEEFDILQSWTLPEHLLLRMTPMSNSGGSWGPDGYLYLTAHDYGAIYVMQLPVAGSVLHHAATVKIADALEGQGIAWDRTETESILWGINNVTREVFKLKMPEIDKTVPFPAAVIRTDNFKKN